PTSGRLAAAIATNCAIRRRICRLVVRNNEVTRCIEIILWPTKSIQGHGAHENGRVEGSAENSNGCTAEGAARSSFVAIKKARKEEFSPPIMRYFGVTPKVRANRSL